jgi:hypothetical protein
MLSLPQPFTHVSLFKNNHTHPWKDQYEQRISIVLFDDCRPGNKIIKDNNK